MESFIFPHYLVKFRSAYNTFYPLIDDAKIYDGLNALCLNMSSSFEPSMHMVFADIPKKNIVARTKTAIENIRVYEVLKPGNYMKTRIVTADKSRLHVIRAGIITHVLYYIKSPSLPLVAWSFLPKAIRVTPKTPEGEHWHLSFPLDGILSYGPE